MPCDKLIAHHSILSPRLSGLWERLEQARYELEKAEALVVSEASVGLALNQQRMEGHPLLLVHESCALNYEQITREFFCQLRQELPIA